MPRTVRAYRLFISSPSDVHEERVIIESVVGELNRTWSASLGLVFELIRWEKDIRPGFSTDPQMVINEQIGDSYDVYIGILWGRFGTPTPRAGSGTEEEFLEALARRNATGVAPEIMVYFKDAPIAPSKIDVVQIQRVRAFKEKIGNLGGLRGEFVDSNGFETSVRGHLSSLAQRFSQKESCAQLALAPAIPEPGPDQDDPGSELGLLDYVEEYNARQSEMCAALQVIAEATHRFEASITKISAEVPKPEEVTVANARRFVRRASQEMQELAQIVGEQTPIVDRAGQKTLSAIGNVLAMYSRHWGDLSDFERHKQELQTLHAAATSAKVGISGMRQAAQTVPPLSREIIHAQRRVTSALDRLIARIDSLAETTVNVIASIDRILDQAGTK